MYARGAADDKAGILVHLAAIGSILESGAELPVNVKVIIEGEEETGSEHLLKFLTQYRSKLDADVLVLTDTTNFDCGIPSLTVALRGMVGLDLEVRALTKAVHSGMWGGPLPDPAAALCKMLAELTDEKGRIAVPGIVEEIPAVSKEAEAELKRIPWDEKKFREQSGLIPGADILQEGPSAYGQTWSYPSLTINALQASSRKQAGNIINDVAWGRVSVRLVPGMNPERVLEKLRRHLESRIPWGLDVKFSVDACASGWKTEPKGPAFDAARVAMEKGYGRAPLMIGCGGTIPFVQPFAEALGGAPALLIGVEDPYTNAHGENESVLIDDLKKACLSQIHLFGELAERLKK